MGVAVGVVVGGATGTEASARRHMNTHWIHSTLAGGGEGRGGEGSAFGK